MRFQIGRDFFGTLVRPIRGLTVLVLKSRRELIFGSKTLCSRLDGTNIYKYEIQIHNRFKFQQTNGKEIIE